MEKKSNKIVIFGKTWSGKTYLCKKLLEKEKGDLIIWDFIGEYKNGIIFYEFDVFSRYVKECVKKRKRIKVILRLHTSFFQSVCEYVRIIKNVLLVIEETDEVCNPSFIPEGLSQLIRFGRHWNIGLISISKRPASVHRLVTSQADIIYCFKFSEPSDLDYLKIYARIEKEKLSNLKQYEYVKKEI